jgi:hypothetical protein
MQKKDLKNLSYAHAHAKLPTLMGCKLKVKTPVSFFFDCIMVSLIKLTPKCGGLFLGNQSGIACESFFYLLEGFI